MRKPKRRFHSDTLEEAVQAQIRVRGDCWLWTGPLLGETPICYVDRKPVRARKVLLQLSGATVAHGAKITQGCGRSLCVNPKHALGGSL